MSHRVIFRRLVLLLLAFVNAVGVLVNSSFAIKGLSEDWQPLVVGLSLVGAILPFLAGLYAVWVIPRFW